jgi:hypothetical protein
MPVAVPERLRRATKEVLGCTAVDLAAGLRAQRSPDTALLPAVAGKLGK